VVDLLEIGDALDAATLQQIREEMGAAEGDAATVLGSTPGDRVASSARRATRMQVGEAARAAVAGVLERIQPRVAAHFGRALDGFEEPQFLRYGPGDYFVAHQDGNTPLVYDDSRFRKVSVVIFLSTQSEHPTPETFCGGSLVLHGPFGQAEPPLTLAPAPGTLVAFPSETTHEVLPVTHGERLSIVSWYRSYDAISA
jgi:predicted 2-oxoglutarate/Fe(II)-dependent dioxygenase YbiX